jgi:phage terminase small subunit
MARPRTATAILDARGAFAKNPKRKREDPKVSDPFPTVAPSHLDPLQVKCWHIIREITPATVLQGADILAVELAACLYAEFRSDPKEMNNGRIGQLRAALGVLGLSPADRARLAVAPTKKAGAFDEF